MIDVGIAKLGLGEDAHAVPARHRHTFAEILDGQPPTPVEE